MANDQSSVRKEPIKPAGRKPNCWEVLDCGREAGGNRAGEQVCPAAVDATGDGINGGKNAGRICWAVRGTFCFNSHQPSVPRKRSMCQSCPFFREVEREEGPRFQLVKWAPDSLGDGGREEQLAWSRRIINNLSHLLAVCRDIMRHAEVNALLRMIAEQACRDCGA